LRAPETAENLLSNRFLDLTLDPLRCLPPEKGGGEDNVVEFRLGRGAPTVGFFRKTGASLAAERRPETPVTKEEEGKKAGLVLRQSSEGMHGRCSD